MTEQRQPRFIHAALLLMGSCLPILGALLIAPVLPKIQAHFAGVPRAEFLTPIALTIPSLMIAALALFAGAIVDKLGRKRVLVVALVFYGFCGIAPIWLDSLQAIIISRAGLGIAEAVIDNGTF
ncbi:MAG: MFS transporter, partial [Acidobacteriota bacterium]